MTVIDVALETLGISYEHLVRPIIEADVETLAETDERFWDALEIRPWPDDWLKPREEVLYHVVSGNHRTRAAHKKQLVTLKAEMIDAPNTLQYQLAAIHSNTRHGKNFTAEQRTLLAQSLVDQGLSVTDVANVFSVNKSTVSRWLNGTMSPKKALQFLNETEEVIVEEQRKAEHMDEFVVDARLVALLNGTPLLTLDMQEARAGFLRLSPTARQQVVELAAFLQELVQC